MPDDDRLALIGDTHHVGHHSAHRDRIARRQERALENLVGVVLDPAGLRIVLRDLLITAPSDAAVGGDHQRGRSRRALIDREYVLHRGRHAKERSDFAAIF